jgi:hypothetical protein
MNQKELDNKISDLLIIRENDGSYFLFGKYKIVVDNLGNHKLLNMKYNELIHNFSNLKNAVTYCVFDKNKKNKWLSRIIELDSLLSGIEVMIAQHEKLAKKSTDLDRKSIYLAKLYEEKLKKREMMKEINGYIQTSKYWQTKKYDENKVR